MTRAEKLARDYAEATNGQFEFARKWTEVEEIYLAGFKAAMEEKEQEQSSENEGGVYECVD